MQTTNPKRLKAWVIPLIMLVVGGVYLVAAWVENLGLGVGMVAVMPAALLLASGRSE